MPTGEQPVVHVSGLPMVTEDGITLVADAWHPDAQRSVAGPSPAAALRPRRGLHARPPPSSLVRPPRLRRRGPGLPRAGRVGRALHPLRRRGARRRGGDRVGRPPALRRWPGGDVRLLVPGLGPGVRRRAAASFAARHRRHDVLPGSLRRLDLRGRMPAVALRRLLERAARRAGAGPRSGGLRRRRPARGRGARPDSAAVARPNGCSTRTTTSTGPAADPTCPPSRSPCSPCWGTSTTSRPAPRCWPRHSAPRRSVARGPTCRGAPATVARSSGRRPDRGRRSRGWWPSSTGSSNGNRPSRRTAGSATTASEPAGGRRRPGHRGIGGSSGAA